MDAVAMAHGVLILNLDTKEFDETLVDMHTHLVDANIVAGLLFGPESLAFKFRTASKLGVPFVVFMRNADTFVLKDMRIKDVSNASANETTHPLALFMDVMSTALETLGLERMN